MSDPNSSNWGAGLVPSAPSTPAPPPYVPAAPPANAAEAQAQLEKLSASPEWRAKVLSGDLGGPGKELRQITEALAKADPVDKALAGVPLDPAAIATTSGQDALTPAHLAQVVSDLRDIGLRDEVIREAFTEGRTYTPEIMRAVRQRHADRMGDKEFVTKYLAGEPTA